MLSRRTVYGSGAGLVAAGLVVLLLWLVGWMPADAEARLLLAVALAVVIVGRIAISARGEAADQAQRFRELLDGVEAIVWEADPATFRVTILSHSAERLLGYPVRRWYEEQGFWLSCVHPDDRDHVREETAARIANGEDYELVYRVVSAEGNVVWLRDIVHIACDSTGAPTRIWGASVDVTERMEAEQHLLESEVRKNAMLSASLDAVVSIDHEGRIVEFDGTAEQTFGYARKDVIGEPMRDLIVPPPLRDAHERGFKRVLAGGEPHVLGRRVELEAMRADGSRFPVELTVVQVDLPGPPVFTAYIRDISEQRAAERARRRAEVELRKEAERNEYLATHDSLTGLANRALFRSSLDRVVESAHSVPVNFAVLIMDLDRFKEINDSLGHRIGDLVLCEVAERFSSCLREPDLVARLGGDEFGVLLHGADQAAAIEVAARLQQALAQPVVIRGLPFEIEASIGAALFPDHGGDVDTLMQRADVALYQSKDSSHGYAVYDQSRNEFEPVRLALAAEFRQALERKELMLHYQPQIDLTTRRVATVEALVRWHHPERGLVLPDHFIPIVERTGLIMPLTSTVLETALRDASAWLATEPGLAVAVNVSMRNLLDASFPCQVAELLERVGVDASRLELEITERCFVGDTKRVEPVLEELSSLGVRIAIDDFGTGYFSLSLLRRLPVDRIKIDRSFVTGMDTNEDDASIVRSTVDLGHDLGLKVVAEGVETQAVCDDLLKIGCDIAQGHLLGRPMTAAALTEWLVDHGRLHIVRKAGDGARVARRGR